MFVLHPTDSPGKGFPQLMNVNSSNFGGNIFVCHCRNVLIFTSNFLHHVLFFSCFLRNETILCFGNIQKPITGRTRFEPIAIIVLAVFMSTVCLQLSAEAIEAVYRMSKGERDAPDITDMTLGIMTVTIGKGNVIT